MQRNDSRHSEEIQDLISAPPSWMLKWGVTVFLVVLILLGGLSFYIRYPDIVRGAVVVRASHAGFIGELSIGQGEVVKVHAGQKVLVKLHRFPSDNFGVVQGVVETVSESPDDKGYFIATIIFNTIPQGIILKERLTGDGEVILRDRSLMDRFLESIQESIAVQLHTSF